jgi:hypothetical protein
MQITHGMVTHSLTFTCGGCIPGLTRDPVIPMERNGDLYNMASLRTILLIYAREARRLVRTPTSHLLKWI